jgi:hypothetical protein
MVLDKKMINEFLSNKKINLDYNLKGFSVSYLLI